MENIPTSMRNNYMKLIDDEVMIMHAFQERMAVEQTDIHTTVKEGWTVFCQARGKIQEPFTVIARAFLP
jgi:hypothetical protein